MFKIVVFLLLMLPFGCWSAEKTHFVLVSVAPHRYFVERIAGDSVRIGLMVPAGDSAHTYEPTPRQVMEACGADAWFIIGEQFEKRASAAMRERNPEMRLVDLRKGLDLIQEHHCCHGNCNDAADPHIWLSARMAKKEAATIAEALAEIYPEKAGEYREKLGLFTAELDQLDREIAGMFTDQSPKLIVVGHPAYAYFCRDYGLKQLSVESEGRDPSPQQLTRMLGLLREDKVQTLFTQPQYNDKGARLIAKQLGIRVVKIDPYSQDYMNAMRSIGRNFSKP